MFRFCFSRLAAGRYHSVASVGLARLSINAPNQSHVLQPSYHNKPRNKIIRPLLDQQRLNRTLTNSSEDQLHDEPERRAEDILEGLDRSISRFEERSQKIERVEEKDFVRTFDSFAKFVQRLSSNGHLTNEIKEALALQAAVLLRCCGRLMTNSHEKARELLAANLWEFIKANGIPIDVALYNSLIRVLNENGTDFDPQKLLDEIEAAGLKPDRITYQRLIHRYCVQGNVTGATSLLEKMKDMDMELTEQIFASLLIGYSKQENPPSISEIFDLMKSNNVEPGSKTYAAAYLSLSELLTKSPQAATELEKLEELVEEDDIQFSIFEIVDLIKNLSNRDNKIISGLIDRLCRTQVSSINSRYRLVAALLKAGDYQRASKVHWSHKPSDRVIQLSNSNLSTYYIRLLAEQKDVPAKHTIDECSKLIEYQHNIKAFHHLYFYAAEAGNLELVRLALQKIGDEEKLKCPYFWPLIAQAKSQDEIIEVLKNDLNPNMDAIELLETFSQWIWPRFEDNYQKVFDANKELRYDTNMLMASFLNYSIQTDKILEAVKFIAEVPPELISEVKNDDQNDDGVEVLDRRQRTPGRNNLIGRLLDQIATETKDPELVNKAFNLCQIPGQKNGANNYAPLVKVHLLRNDFESALEAFMKVAKESGFAPCKYSLISHCLEKKDPESLQKIMDISTSVHGEGNSLFDLAICCLEVGKLKQAQKIFSNPALRVSPQRVHLACKRLARQGNVDVLENFVHLARDIYDVDQESLYQALLDTYERTQNGKRALSLWNRMQEEDFQPSKRSLLMIARVLERNNIEVPFQKPKMDLVRNEIRHL